jgi:hypothetical protein
MKLADHHAFENAGFVVGFLSQERFDCRSIWQVDGQNHPNPGLTFIIEQSAANDHFVAIPVDVLHVSKTRPIPERLRARPIKADYSKRQRLLLKLIFSEAATNF